MVRRWFPHGQWPRLLVGLHYYTMGSFLLLLVTGVALYLPAVHTPLIPLLPYIRKIHIILGFIFTATLLTPFLRRLFPTGKRLSRPDWLIPTAVGVAIVWTGVLLWAIRVFPASWRAPAFSWHGWLSALLTAWILIHSIMKAFGVRPRSDGRLGRMDLERRTFVKSLGWGLGGAFVLTIFRPGAAFRSLVNGTEQASGPPSTTFAEYYTVVAGYPGMTLQNYRLQVDGDVGKPTTLTWADLQNLTATSETVNFQCVTGWSVANVHWKGIHLQDLVDLVHPRSDVRYVHFYSFDGAYTECLTLDEALDPTVLLATHLNGQPLLAKQGFPLRLVVPKMYGYKSIKWVNRVSFSATPITGYWEQRGYPTEARL